MYFITDITFSYFRMSACTFLLQVINVELHVQMLLFLTT